MLMIIGGLEKLSLIDYPEKLSAVIFTVGCTFRCPFCYNPMLVLPEYGKNLNSSLLGGEEGEGHSLIKKDDLFHFLQKRRGKLDAVVITGGEPTMQADLPEFIREVRALGFLIKLDTNGTNPALLKKLLDEKLIDYLAMDIKAAPEDYERCTGLGHHLRNNLPAVSASLGLQPLQDSSKYCRYSSSSFSGFGASGIQNAKEAISKVVPKFDFEKIKQSVKLIKESGVPYEFRTTCVPGFIDKKSIEKMGELIAGADKWYLQKFRSNAELIDKSLEGKLDFTDKEMRGFAEIGKNFVKKCEMRG